MFKLITRSEWKALPPSCTLEDQHPLKITIHHLGNEKYPKKPIMTAFRGAKTIQQIQKNNMLNHHPDIDHHAIIAPNGDVYEGRLFHKKGNHSKYNDARNIGILIFGNFEVETPTPEQLSACKQLLVYLQTLFPQLKVPQCIFGHREFNFIPCPGENLWKVIQSWKYGKESIFSM